MKYQSRYPTNWTEISLSIKNAAGWKCKSCGYQCRRPGEGAELTKSEKLKLTLQVHHSNHDPEDNRPENLIPLCTICHLARHNRHQGNVSPGQLKLNLKF